MKIKTWYCTFNSNQTCAELLTLSVQVNTYISQMATETVIPQIQ